MVAAAVVNPVLLMKNSSYAIGAGVSAASEQLLPAVGSIYFATKDLQEACHKYNEAIELEKHLNNLQHLKSNDDEKDNSHSWWQFWK